MSMLDDYNLHKDDRFSVREIAEGVCTIVTYAGAAVGFFIVLSWVASVVVPIMSWAGAPITLGTLMAGCRALNYGWKGLSEDSKKKLLPH